jgi:stage III sporulation protein AH
MLSRKKKIFIISAFVVLLAITGALNIIINNRVVENVNAEITATSANFFVTYRADRQDTRDQEIVYLDAIIASASSSAEAKSAAESKRQALVSQMDSELMLEGLIKAKGFEDAIVSTSSSNINVIVKSSELQESEVAQIVEIIQGQTNYNLDNIKIIPVE